MNLSVLVVSLLVVHLLGLISAQTEVADYINTVKAYYRHRKLWTLTHFSCYSMHENANISIELSKVKIQSRFITAFNRIQRLIDTPTTSIQGLVVNLRCTNVEEIFKQEDHAILFKNNNYWMLIDFDNGIQRDETAKTELELGILIELNALPISNVIIAKRTKINPIKWTLYDFYRLGIGYEIEISELGSIDEITCDFDRYEKYNNSNGRRTCLQVKGNFLSSRRRNLKGVSVICGLVIAYPELYTYLDDPSNNHIDIFSKGTINVAATMREDLNISCNMIQRDNYGWESNGTFSGMMGLFQMKKVQMLAHGTIMRVDRMKHVEFTGDLFKTRTPLIFRQPPLSSIKNIFILPLDMQVWRCLIFLLVVIFIIMACQLLHPLLKRKISSFDVATFVWGAVCQQGTHLNIPTTSGRFVVMTTFLATLALFTSYSATIVALLQSPGNFIKTIDDLIASPLKIGVHDAGYSRFYVMHGNDTVTKKMYAKKIEPYGEAAWIYDSFAGIERMRTELFAYQIDSASAYKAIGKTFTEYEKCSLSELQMIILPMTTITVERDFAYKELIKQRIGWQREIGLLKREHLRWIPKKPECKSGGRGFVTVGLAEVKPALILLLLGYIFSLAIIAIEVLNKQILVRINI